MILCLISEAQTIYDKALGRVSETIEIYRKLRNKSLLCDSVLNDQQDRLNFKDSIINANQLERASLQRTIMQKDTTIYKLENIAIKQTKIERNPLTYIIAIGALVLGIALGK